MTPVLPDGKDNGLTLPLRHVVTGLSEAGVVAITYLRRSGRPPVDSLLRLLQGSECYASASLRAAAKDPKNREKMLSSPVRVGFLGSTAALLPGTSGAKRICIVQDSILRISQHNGRYEGVPVAVRRALDLSNERYERKVYSKLDAIVVTSTTERDFLASIGVECRIVVNPNGVDLPSASLTRRVDSDIVLMGNYEDQRNIRIAERGFATAVELAMQLGRRIKVLIVGWNATNVPIPRGDIEVEIQPNAEDVQSAISRGRCFVTLDPDSTGIKNSVLNMLSVGVPGVVSDEVAESFIGVDSKSALTIVGSNPAEAAKAVRALLSSEALLRKSQADAVELASHFSWQAYESRLTELVLGL